MFPFPRYFLIPLIFCHTYPSTFFFFFFSGRLFFDHTWCDYYGVCFHQPSKLYQSKDFVSFVGLKSPVPSRTSGTEERFNKHLLNEWMSEWLLAARIAVAQASIQGDSLNMFVECLLGPRHLSGDYSNENYLILCSWSLHSSGKREHE